MRKIPRPRDDAAGLTIHRLRSLEAAAVNIEYFTTGESIATGRLIITDSCSRAVVRRTLVRGQLFAKPFFAGNVVRGVSCSPDSYAHGRTISRLPVNTVNLLGMSVIQAYYRPVLKLRRSSGMHERGPWRHKIPVIRSLLNHPWGLRLQ